MTEKERRLISPVLEHLKRVFDYVVLDVGGCYDETAVQAIKNSDMLVMVSTLSLPSIGNTQKALQYFAGMGLSGKSIKLLVNRFSKKDEVNIKDAEKVFGKKITWQGQTRIWMLKIPRTRASHSSSSSPLPMRQKVLCS